jgi:hypothetical protein
MKKLFLLIAVIISIQCFGQFPPGYTGINTRYDWLAGRFRALHMPVFNGIPSLQTGQWAADGAFGMDTSTGRLYIYYNTAWLRVLNAGDSTLYTTITRLKDTADAIRADMGTGGGNPNANVGSAYRLAIPNTNNLKTVSTSNILDIDSSTSNQLNFKTRQTPFSVSSSSGSITLNLNNGYVQYTTLTEDIPTVTISNALDGTVGVWAIIQGAGPYNVTVPGAGLLSLSATSGDTTIVAFVKVGSNYFWHSQAGSSGSITSLTGDVTGTGPGATATTIGNNVVSFAKFQTLNANKLLGARVSGNVVEIGLGSGFSIDASNDLQFSGGSGITINSTAITSGTAQRILFQNGSNQVSQAAGWAITPGNSALLSLTSTNGVLTQRFNLSSGTAGDIEYNGNQFNFWPSGVNVMTLDGTNGVAINTGTFTSGFKLKVNGAFLIQSTTGQRNISSNTVFETNYQNSDNTGGYHDYDTKDHVWWNDGTRTFRITTAAIRPNTSGQLTIGTSSVPFGNTFLGSTNYIDWGNNNARITHSSGLLTSSVDFVVPAETYGVGWNGSNEVPTKNDVYDKIEAVIATIPTVASGTYTPTLTNVTNLDGSTAYALQYMQVGNTITVSGKVDIDPTSNGPTVLGISLPIASTFASNGECGGAGREHANGAAPAGIIADTSNSRAELQIAVGSGTATTITFTFTYKLTPP